MPGGRPFQNPMHPGHSDFGTFSISTGKCDLEDPNGSNGQFRRKVWSAKPIISASL